MVHETGFEHMLTHMSVGGGIAFAVLVVGVAWVIVTFLRAL